MNPFVPNLSILPPPQKILWPKLHTTPKHFVLYGGTALALRLGHRTSIDYDFFSNKTFNPRELQRSISYLSNSTERQASTDTLVVTTSTEQGEVQCSYFGNLRLKQINRPDTAEDNLIAIASTEDIFGMKCATIYQRAETKDYLDIIAILQQTELNLTNGLSAAMAIYDRQYNPMMTLQALSYTEDLIPALSESQIECLQRAIKSVNPASLPTIETCNFIGTYVE